MDVKKITDLIAKSQWTAMLAELPTGSHIIPFPSVDAIRSCKATAYALNSDKKGRRYTFNVDKGALSAAIHVEEIA